MNMEHEPKNERDCRKTSVSQRNITTRDDMSQTCHMRHIIRQKTRILKNNFGHVTICLMQHFNPIQSKWVVAPQMREV